MKKLSPTFSKTKQLIKYSDIINARVYYNKNNKQYSLSIPKKQFPKENNIDDKLKSLKRLAFKIIWK